MNGVDSAALAKVERDEAGYMYRASWTDGHTAIYPYVWMQDNCRCDYCYQDSAYQKLVLVKELDADITPKEESISEDGAILTVKWSNNHVGKFPSAWLRQHKFDKGHYDPIPDLRLRPWGKEFLKEIPHFKYNDVMTNDDVLFDWLKILSITGLAILKEAPKKGGAVEDLANRVSHLRRTSYGKTFQVYVKEKASSTAYTCREVGPHTDTAGYRYTPGVQLLHCILQTRGTGGENQFVDALNAINILEKEYPKFYNILTTLKIYHRMTGYDDNKEFHYICHKPIIELDDEGNFKALNFNNQMRASYMDVPVERVREYYQAITKLHDIFYANEIQLRLNDGEIATMDNIRVLHARFAFEVKPVAGEITRHYEGGYVDWDDIYSRLRVLQERKDGILRV